MDKKEKISKKGSTNRIRFYSKVLQHKLLGVEQSYEKVLELKNELDVLLSGTFSRSTQVVRRVDDIDISIPVNLGEYVQCYEHELAMKQLSVDIPVVELNEHKPEVFFGWSKIAAEILSSRDFSPFLAIDDPELYVNPYFIEVAQAIIANPDRVSRRTIKKLRRVLTKSEKQLRRAIGNTKRLLNNFINLDLRSKIRSILRSLHISTDDGKDADSDFIVNKNVNRNHLNNFKIKIKCRVKLPKGNNFRWWNMPSLN